LQPGWPTNWENFNAYIPYDGMQNMCKDCSSLDNTDCKRNTQSPINLERDVTAKKECIDKHRMNFITGDCKVGWLDFQILPHGKNQFFSFIGTCCDWILTQPLSLMPPRSFAGLPAQEL
jgi:hypothetical protein